MDELTTADDVAVDDRVDPSRNFEHVVIEADGQQEECTIFPRECTEAELLTNWVTARGEAFVALEDAV